jgi:hypothetical protein
VWSKRGELSASIDGDTWILRHADGRLPARLRRDGRGGWRLVGPVVGSSGRSSAMPRFAHSPRPPC